MIINELSECYIISILQIVKFLKYLYQQLNKLIESGWSNTDRYILLDELNKLLTEQTIKLDNFINILSKYITLYKLDFNLNTINNTTDFINILFYIIDTNIDTKLYIHNVYSDIKRIYTRIKKNK